MSELQSKYEFEIALKEVPVKLLDPKSKTERWYIIRELDGEGRDNWFNNVGGRMRTNEKGDVVGVKDFKGMHGTLLTLSMMEAEQELTGDEDEDRDNPIVKSTGKKVTLSTVQRWPASVQDKLFDISKQLSGLDDEAKERAKND